MHYGQFAMKQPAGEEASKEFPIAFLIEEAELYVLNEITEDVQSSRK